MILNHMGDKPPGTLVIDCLASGHDRYANSGGRSMLKVGLGAGVCKKEKVKWAQALIITLLPDASSSHGLGFPAKMDCVTES